MAAVAATWYYTKVAFLWHNLIGTAVVLSVGLAISVLLPTKKG